MNYEVMEYLKRMNLTNIDFSATFCKFQCPMPGCKQDGKQKAYVLKLDTESPYFYCHRCNARRKKF